MCVNFLRLPYDAVSVITSQLCPAELLTLRLVNKESQRAVDALPNWHDETLRRWFVSDDQVAEKGRLYDFQYYSNRAKNDHQLIKKLDLIQNRTMLSFEEILDIVREFTDNNGLSFIPVLEKIISSVNKIDQLSKIAYAGIMLRTIRRKTVFETLDDMKSSRALKPLSSTIEEIYYRLSYLDPSFSANQKYRKLVRDKVVYGLGSDLKFFDLSPTEQIEEINKQFIQETIDLGDTMDFHFMVSEDASILRVYSGEEMGLPLMRLSIIQKFALELGLSVELLHTTVKIDQMNRSSGVLKVIDPYVPGGVSFLYFENYIQAIQDPNLIVMNSLDFTHELIQRKLINYAENCFTVTIPFTNRTVVDAYYSDLQGVRSKLGDYDTNEANIEFFFPHSKDFLNTEYIYQVSCYLVSIYANLRKKPKPPGRNVLKACDEAPSDFYRVLVDFEPWDLGVIHNENIFKEIPYVDLKKYIVENYFNVEEVLEIIPDDINERINQKKPFPEFFPGQIMKHNDTYFIVNGYKMGTNGEPTEFSVLHIRSGIFVNVEYNNLSRAIYVGELDVGSMTIAADIGRFYERYDRSLQRFIPIKKVRDLYSGFEELEHIESPSETNIRAETTYRNLNHRLDPRQIRVSDLYGDLRGNTESDQEDEEVGHDDSDSLDDEEVEHDNSDFLDDEDSLSGTHFNLAQLMQSFGGENTQDLRASLAERLDTFGEFAPNIRYLLTNLQQRPPELEASYQALRELTDEPQTEAEEAELQSQIENQFLSQLLLGSMLSNVGQSANSDSEEENKKEEGPGLFDVE